MSPTVGCIVHFRPGLADVEIKAHYIGDGAVVAAVVTRVWNYQLVNLTVFVDNAAPVVRTSVQHAEVASKDASSWDWPPRV